MITPTLAVLPALIAKSSICYNPVIYVGMNTQVSHHNIYWRNIFSVNILFISFVRLCEEFVDMKTLNWQITIRPLINFLRQAAERTLNALSRVLTKRRRIDTNFKLKPKPILSVRIPSSFHVQPKFIKAPISLQPI